MTPSFSRGSKGKHYRYYVSASLQQGAKPNGDINQRLPAGEIEDMVSEFAARITRSKKRPFDEVAAVHLHPEQVQIDIEPDALRNSPPSLDDGESVIFENKSVVRFSIAISLPRRGGRCTIVPSKAPKPRPDKALICALRKAHKLIQTERGLPLIHAAPTSPYDRKIQRLAFLSPDIQRDIMKGLQPPTLNLKKLLQIAIPLEWHAQKEALGWIENRVPCSS